MLRPGSQWDVNPKAERTGGKTESNKKRAFIVVNETASTERELTKPKLGETKT